MAKIAWQINVFWSLALGWKFFVKKNFFAQMNANFFGFKRIQGSRDIRLLIEDRVTDGQSDRVRESHHFHSVYMWVKFCMPIFNKLPYLLCSQGDNLSLNVHQIIPSVSNWTLNQLLSRVGHCTWMCTKANLLLSCLELHQTFWVKSN